MARALSSSRGRRILVGLAVLLILFLWLNMVRRAMQGHGSQWDDFIAFSRHLVFDGVNVYREYDWQVTSVHNYPPFFPVFLSPLVPLPTHLAATILFFLCLVPTRPRESPERRLMFWALVASFVLVSSSASRLMQALSLPFLGALILAAVMGALLLRERRGELAGLARDPFAPARAGAGTPTG